MSVKQVTLKVRLSNIMHRHTRQVSREARHPIGQNQLGRY